MIERKLRDDLCAQVQDPHLAGISWSGCVATSKDTTVALCYWATPTQFVASHVCWGIEVLGDLSKVSYAKSNP